MSVFSNLSRAFIGLPSSGPGADDYKLCDFVFYRLIGFS